MDSSTDLRSYLITLATVACLTSLGAALFNLAVDPYGMFGTARLRGFNATKPSAPDHIYYTKGYYGERAMARTLITGNSRPEAGLDPASPCWSEAQRPVFNTAVPGTSFADQMRYLVHAAADGTAQQAFVGLDFLDFLTQQAAAPDYASWPGNPTTLDQRLRTRLDGTPNPRYVWNRITDWTRGLFSLETVLDSVVTILRQQDPVAPTCRADGFNPGLDYLPIIHSEGQTVLFLQKNRELAQRLAQPGQVLYQGDRHWSWNLETLERLLLLAKVQGITVTLFINPYHSDYLTAIAAAGHWPQLEEWKRTLLQIAERHGIALWDFHAFDATTMEPAPRRGDLRHELRWFWEPAHYRAAYGERMLSAMLGNDCATTAPPAGVRLTEETLESHLADLRRGLESVNTNPPRKPD